MKKIFSRNTFINLEEFVSSLFSDVGVMNNVYRYHIDPAVLPCKITFVFFSVPSFSFRSSCPNIDEN